MKVPVVITAAGPSHSHLLHQTIVTPENQRLTMARFLLDLVQDAAQRIAFVVSPESASSIRALIGEQSSAPVTLIEQPEPRGYAHALFQARDFIAGEPFLHLVGDHFYLAQPPEPPKSLIARLLDLFEREQASISAVQATRESMIGSFGAAAGPAIAPHLYQVETIREKPTPTEAEQFLVSPGLRAGQYLCFFGIHLFTPGLMRILDEEFFSQGRRPSSVSEALQLLAQRERYLACVLPGQRFDLGSKFGLLQAQLALSLQGPDRGDVLELVLELLAR
jgi:UTP--glucose-1-phosphate uridylyltransferase